MKLYYNPDYEKLSFIDMWNDLQLYSLLEIKRDFPKSSEYLQWKVITSFEWSMKYHEELTGIIFQKEWQQL